MSRFRLKPPPKLKLVENDVETACLQLLAYRGWYPVRLQSGLFKTPDGRWVRVGAVGLPDYVCLHERHPAFFLETKRPASGLSAQQAKKQWELRVAYKLAVATVDRVEALTPWLDAHEAKARGP
jgi:hypothetical protein